MNIYDYAKLSLNEKGMVLRNDALLLEYYHDKGSTVYIYYLNNFFVEVTITDGEVTDNLPFIRGYTIGKSKLHSLQKRNVLNILAA